ncbi:hypothetical protein Agub_g10127 [Astrephomene gubernaculifera]|uniref:SMP-LTD domain-containing protein n=1 Tax=Astrephomene gubernaculifera TaxID=47775 RepID=A0AAD3HPQ2_9CHLO|nr:hypothetical protein Agub_g10127 [Astrephomene gubernaculifera]
MWFVVTLLVPFLACGLVVGAFALAWDVASTKHKKQVHSITARFEAALRAAESTGGGAAPATCGGTAAAGNHSSSPGNHASCGGGGGCGGCSGSCGGGGVAAMYESFTLGWLNLVVQHMWLPVLEKFVSTIAAEKLQIVLNEVLRKNGGRAPWKLIESVAVEEVTFGLAPPQFQFCTAKYDPSRSYLLLTMNMRFHSNGFQAVLSPRMRQMLGLRPFSVRLEVTQLRLAGQLHLGLHLTREPPGIKGIDYSFAAPPEFDIQASPLGYIQLHGELPGLVANLRGLLQRIINRRLVEPNRRFLDLQRIYRNKHLQRVGGPGGCLRVCVIGGRNLLRMQPVAASSTAAATTTTAGGSSSSSGGSTSSSTAAAASNCDPYVEMRFGREVFRTPIAHSSADPVFNWQFDIRLPADLPPPPATASSSSSSAAAAATATPGISRETSEPCMLHFRVLNARTFGEPEVLSTAHLDAGGLGLQPNADPRVRLLELAAAGSNGAPRGTLSLQISWLKALPKKPSPFPQATPGATRTAATASPTPPTPTSSSTPDLRQPSSPGASPFTTTTASSAPAGTPQPGASHPCAASSPLSSSSPTSSSPPVRHLDPGNTTRSAAGSLLAAAQAVTGSRSMPGSPGASPLSHPHNPAAVSAAACALAVTPTAHPGHPLDPNTPPQAMHTPTHPSRLASPGPHASSPFSLASSVAAAGAAAPAPPPPAAVHAPSHGSRKVMLRVGGWPFLRPGGGAARARSVRALAPELALAAAAAAGGGPGHGRGDGGGGGGGGASRPPREVELVQQPAVAAEEGAAGHDDDDGGYGYSRGASASFTAEVRTASVVVATSSSSVAVSAAGGGGGTAAATAAAQSLRRSGSGADRRKRRRAMSGLLALVWRVRRSGGGGNAGAVAASASRPAVGGDGGGGDFPGTTARYPIQPEPSGSESTATTTTTTTNTTNTTNMGAVMVIDASSTPASAPSASYLSPFARPSHAAMVAAAAGQEEEEEQEEEQGEEGVGAAAAPAVAAAAAGGGSDVTPTALPSGGTSGAATAATEREFAPTPGGHIRNASRVSEASTAAGAAGAAGDASGFSRSSSRLAGVLMVRGAAASAAAVMGPAYGEHSLNSSSADCSSRVQQLQQQQQQRIPGETSANVAANPTATTTLILATETSFPTPHTLTPESSGQEPTASSLPLPQRQHAQGPAAAATATTAAAATPSSATPSPSHGAMPATTRTQPGTISNNSTSVTSTVGNSNSSGTLHGGLGGVLPLARSPSRASTHARSTSCGGPPSVVAARRMAAVTAATHGSPATHGSLPTTNAGKSDVMTHGSQWPASLQSLAQVVKMQRLLEVERQARSEAQEALLRTQRQYEALVRLRRFESKRALMEGARFLLHLGPHVRWVVLWLNEPRGLLHVHDPEGAASAAAAGRGAGGEAAAGGGGGGGGGGGAAAAAVGGEPWPRVFAPQDIQRADRGCASFPNPSAWAGVVAALMGRQRPAPPASLDPRKCFSLSLEGGRSLHLQLPPAGNGRSRDEWLDALQDLALEAAAARATVAAAAIGRDEASVGI